MALLIECLDVRVAYEKALLNGDVDVQEVALDGYFLGATYRQKGLPCVVPPLLANCAELAVSWKHGWQMRDDDLASSWEMENCSSCIAARGDPCHIHG